MYSDFNLLDYNLHKLTEICESLDDEYIIM